MTTPADPPPRRNLLLKRLGTVVLVVGLLALALLSLPRGFDTDLSRIGAGKPALVFVYDPNLVASNQQTRAMDSARERTGDALHFLIADVGKPDAQRFMQVHQARPTQLLLFAADGREVGRMQAVVPAQDLLAALKAAGVGG